MGDDARLALPGRLRYFASSTEKGGPRDDFFRHYPASVAQFTPCKCVCRADPGTSRQNFFLVCPSWPCGLALVALACIHSSPRFDTDIRRRPRAPDNVIAARPENDHDPYHPPQSRRDAWRAAVFRLNLVVNAGDRIGLVAANGRGKTTLLRCMAGAMEASEGEITRSSGLTIGYVEQNVPEALMDRTVHAAVLDALSPTSSSAKAGGSMWRWSSSKCPRRCARCR